MHGLSGILDNKGTALAPAYVYLAGQDSSYVSGQVIHINGGTVLNG